MLFSVIFAGLALLPSQAIQTFGGEQDRESSLLQVSNPSASVGTNCGSFQGLTAVGGRSDGYGRWWICEQGLNRASKPTVMSIGIGEDASFDRMMIERFGATVYGFDPTPKAKLYVESEQHAAAKPGGSHWTDSFHFEELGVGASDREASFALPTNPSYVSGRIVEGEVGDVQVQIRSLPSLLRRAGGKVDILKMDVEGSEFETLAYLMNSGDCSALPFGQLLVEYHNMDKRQREMEQHVQFFSKCGLARLKVGPERGTYAFVPVSH